jgi:hypothetical protein
MKKLFYSLFALAMTAMTFISCDDVPAPYGDPNSNKTDTTVVETPAGTGTQTDPFNVAAANKYIKDGGSETADVYVKGKVVSVTIDTSYGNATYYISSDGTTTNKFEIYRGLSLGNKKFTSTDELKVGDEVVVCGKLVNFKGTYEMTQGSYIYSLNGKTAGGGTTGEPTGDGTLASPYNVAKALDIINTGKASTDNVYISGTISKIDKVDTSYGNATYYISDDGGTTTQLEVYRGYSLNGAKFASESEIKVGDKVVISGVLVLYNSTPEVTKGSQIVSINANGGNTDTAPTSDVTITKADNVITMVNSKVTASSNTITCDIANTGQTDKTDPVKITLTDGTTITFAQENGSNAPQFYTASKGVRMYALNSMTVTGSKPIAKMVITCDVYNKVNEVGNDGLYTKVNGNIWKMVNYFTTSTGGTQVRVQTIQITYAQ